jgi:hypothetical protein
MNEDENELFEKILQNRLVLQDLRKFVGRTYNFNSVPVRCSGIEGYADRILLKEFGWRFEPVVIKRQTHVIDADAPAVARYSPVQVSQQFGGRNFKILLRRADSMDSSSFHELLVQDFAQQLSRRLRKARKRKKH